MLDLGYIYAPADWYWRKDGADTAFSSARIANVPLSDAAFLAWCGRTGIPDPATLANWPADPAGAQTDAALRAELQRYGLPASLGDYAAAKRYAVETGGIVVNGLAVATDRESQAMIGNAYAFVQASDAASVSYKTAAGFASLTAEQIKAVALAVGAHVQACFKAEDTADAGINATPPAITSIAQVDALFAALSPTSAA